MWKKLLTMQALNVVLILALPVTTIVFAFLKTDVATIIAVIGSIALALTFANLDQIARFKASFLELEMKEKIKEAQAAITDLKNLALALTNPIVTLYTFEGSGMIVSGTDGFGA